MLTIQCDMDDTFVGFRKSVQNISGIDWTGKNMSEQAFLDCIDQGAFIKADWTPGGLALVTNLETLEDYYDVTVEILSSTGRQFLNQEYRDKIIEQKKAWLAMRQIGWKLNVVHTELNKTDKEAKADFANPNSLIIDDSPNNVEIFKQHGGYGILYDGDVKRILEELKVCLESHYGNDADTTMILT